MQLDPNFHYHQGHGGGKTTKLMLDAIALLETYQSVIFLTATREEARWCARHFDAIVSDNDTPSPIRYIAPLVWQMTETAANIEFVAASTHPMSRMLNRPPPSVLIDHWTYEAASDHDLERWIDVATLRHQSLGKPY